MLVGTNAILRRFLVLNPEARLRLAVCDSGGWFAVIEQPRQSEIVVSGQSEIVVSGRTIESAIEAMATALIRDGLA